MTKIKVCGVTSLEDALMLEREGVDAIGFNFVPSSPRFVTPLVAKLICKELKALTVAVVANLSSDDVRRLLSETGIACVQFHGAESPALVSEFLPHAYKAIAIRTAGDVASADAYPGEHVLLDAKVEGLLGGSGQTFDWDLVKNLVDRRKVTLAGGLNPSNVARAIATVRPYCVDVASGVESTPGVKDEALVRAFVRAAQDGGGGPARQGSSG